MSGDDAFDDQRGRALRLARDETLEAIALLDNAAARIKNLGYPAEYALRVGFRRAVDAAHDIRREIEQQPSSGAVRQ